MIVTHFISIAYRSLLGLKLHVFNFIGDEASPSGVFMTISLNVGGVNTLDEVNRLTAALIELDGVTNVEVSRHSVEVEGQVSRSIVIKTIEKLGFKAKG